MRSVWNFEKILNKTTLQNLSPPPPLPGSFPDSPVGPARPPPPPPGPLYLVSSEPQNFSVPQLHCDLFPAQNLRIRDFLSPHPFVKPIPTRPSSLILDAASSGKTCATSSVSKTGSGGPPAPAPPHPGRRRRGNVPRSSSLPKPGTAARPRSGQ